MIGSHEAREGEVAHNFSLTSLPDANCYRPAERHSTDSPGVLSRYGHGVTIHIWSR